MKNKVLKGIAAVMAVAFIWAAAGYDSGSTVPHIVLTVSLIWCGLFLMANRKGLAWGRE